MLPELTLATKIRRLRGTTPQNVVARAAGTTPSTLCRLEKGERDHARSAQSVTLRAETLRKLAAHFRVLPEYLTSSLTAYLKKWAVTVLADPQLRTPGQRFTRLLEELEFRYGIDLTQFGALVGVNDQDLRDYQEDRIPIGQTLAARLEDTTGVPISWVLQRPDEPNWDAAAYERPLALALTGGIPPQALEELIRSWLAKNREQK